MPANVSSTTSGVSIIPESLNLYAKDFVKSDIIVVAAPYWDLSFPSVLKVFFEHINILKLVFDYSDKGEIVPLGLSVFTRISLSKEAAEELENKYVLMKKDYENQTKKTNCMHIEKNNRANSR